LCSHQATGGELSSRIAQSSACLTGQTSGLPIANQLDSHFLFHFLSSNQFQNLLKQDSSGSTATGIQRLKFEKITVFYPLLLAEQTAIAAILTDMDAEIVALEKKLAKAYQVK